MPQGPYGPPAAQQQSSGWGAPPTVPPPGGHRKGKAAGIVGLAAAVGLAALFLAGQVGSAILGARFPEAEYTLTMPKTLLDGRYELTRDRSDSDGRKYAEQMDRASDAKDVKGLFGDYALGGDSAEGSLVVIGMYGRFKYPDATRKGMMKGAGDGDSEIVVAARDFHPDGADGTTITCEVAVGSSTGQKVTVPTCGWTDDNTLGSVAQATPDALTQDPSGVDLDELAATTVRIRAEMRKPIG